MGGDGQRVEMRPDRDATQDRLRENPRHAAPGQQHERGSPGLPAHGDDDRQDDDDEQRERQHPVAELDRGVEALRLVLGRRERSVNAVRPGRTTQARPGQADQSAGDDDQALRPHQGEVGASLQRRRLLRSRRPIGGKDHARKGR